DQAASTLLAHLGLGDPALLAPDIRDWLEAENAAAEAWLEPHAELRSQLVAEMRGRIKEDDASVPSADGPFAYFTRFREGGQHPLICRRPAGAIAGETVLLDGDALAEGKAYFQFGDARQSPDHRLYAWTADEAGSEYYTLRIRDIDAGTDLPDLVAESTGDVLWSADGAYLFYIRRDAEHRPSFVYRHRLGTDPAEDVLVYEEPDKGFFVSLGHTQSRRFGLISCGDHDTSEVWLIDLNSPLEAPVLVEPREAGLRYGVEHHPALDGVESLIIETNADGAEDFKIVAAPLGTPGRAHWRDLVPHKAGRLLLSVCVLRGHLIRLEREDGLPRLVIRALADGAEHAVAFAEEAYSLGFDPGFGFDKTEIRFTYSSMTTPSEVWDYDVASRARVLRKRQEVPSGHDPKRYVTRRLMAPAED
ncbi:MAG: S9 family peptidase, partial [Starkeya sp.]|nr:S9 family peptidase [Starkeya sp.]